MEIQDLVNKKIIKIKGLSYFNFFFDLGNRASTTELIPPLGLNSPVTFARTG